MSEYVDALRESGSLEHSTIVCYGTSLGYIVRDLSNVPVVSLATARVQRFVNVLDEDGRANVLRILGGLERTPGVIAAYVELYTGMRQGEIAGLRWRAVDLEVGDVHVCEAIAVSAEGGTYSKPPKTNQDRHVPLARGLESILKEWRASQEEQWRAGHPDWKERGLSFGDTYVVGDDTGRWRNPHSIGKDWTTISRLFGLRGTQGRNVTFHDLRHTFATAAISKGAVIRSVSDILGHENVAMTLNVYADADPHAKRRTIDMLDMEFSAVGAGNGASRRALWSRPFPPEGRRNGSRGHDWRARRAREARGPPRSRRDGPLWIRRACARLAPPAPAREDGARAGKGHGERARERGRVAGLREGAGPRRGGRG